MTTVSWGVPLRAAGPSATMTLVKGRVLVVDDDTALAEMLGIVLRTEGFEPVFCADGAKALAAFRESKPDLVLLDLMLPGRDGIDVCRSIRAESGGPIVMLTAKTDTVDIVLGLEGGLLTVLPLTGVTTEATLAAAGPEQLPHIVVKNLAALAGIRT